MKTSNKILLVYLIIVTIILAIAYTLNVKKLVASKSVIEKFSEGELEKVKVIRFIRDVNQEELTINFPDPKESWSWSYPTERTFAFNSEIDSTFRISNDTLYVPTENLEGASATFNELKSIMDNDKVVHNCSDTVMVQFDRRIENVITIRYKK